MPSPVPRERGFSISSRRADRGALHFAADKRLELGEIVLEPAAQAARHLVIGPLVGPGAARVEHIGRDLGTALGHQEPEIGVLAHRRPGEAAVERGAQQRAGMGDRHALADPVGAARPAGIDEPAIGLEAGDAVAQHLGVLRGVTRHERRAEAGREHRLGLLAEPDLGAGDLRRIAREKMVHRLLGGELGDRRHDPERVAGQHDDVFGMRRHPVLVGIGDEVERIAGPGVFGEAVVVNVGHPAHRVDHDVFEHGPEPGDRARRSRARLWATG